MSRPRSLLVTGSSGLVGSAYGFYLAPLVERHFLASDPKAPRVVNVGGGRASAVPLRQLSDWCIASTVEHLHRELALHRVPHEIVVVDDGRTDARKRVA